MKNYRCHKVVSAMKIKEILIAADNDGFALYPEDEDNQPFIGVSREFVEKHKPEVGGYFVIYEDGYRSHSPAAAFEAGYTEIDPEDMRLSSALELRFDSDAGDLTIRDYLRTLLTMVWEEGEDFDGKRPFGNSGWEHDLYKPLIKAGHIGGKLDENGYFEEVNYRQGNEFVKQLIASVFGGVR